MVNSRMHCPCRLSSTRSVEQRNRSLHTSLSITASQSHRFRLTSTYVYRKKKKKIVADLYNCLACTCSLSLSHTKSFLTKQSKQQIAMPAKKKKIIYISYIGLCNAQIPPHPYFQPPPSRPPKTNQRVVAISHTYLFAKHTKKKEKKKTPSYFTHRANQDGTSPAQNPPNAKAGRDLSPCAARHHDFPSKAPLSLSIKSPAVPSLRISQTSFK